MNIPESKTVILVVGRFEPRKNQMFALELIRSLPSNFYLLMVGPTDASVKWYLDEINFMMRKNGIYKKVEIYSEYRTDIDKFYRMADILCIPSRSEGTPNAMLEALCSGVPVIANNDLQLDRFILDGRNGYNITLKHKIFEQYILKTEELLLNRDVRHNIAQEAALKFGSEKIDQDLYKFINQVIF